MDGGGRFAACCVEAELAPGFHVIFAASRPLRQARFDLETTRTLVGFEPRDQWPEGVQ